jgi:hypothetical protein
MRDRLSLLADPFRRIPAVNAGVLTSVLDKPVSQWTAASLHRTFLAHGCAILRGAIDRGRLADTRLAIEEAYVQYPGLHVHDPHIRTVTKERMSGWELADIPLLQGFLKLVFAGQNWGGREMTARRIQGFDRDSRDWQRPLDLHLDSQFHGVSFTVNFWIPFDPCGVDAPALQLVPVDYKTTRAYAGFRGRLRRKDDPWFFGYFTKDALDVDAVTKTFGENCFLRPVVTPGDVIVLSNWIIHGSYRTAKMRTGRTSAELRYIGSNLDVAVD